MSTRQKDATPNALRTRTEEGRRQVAVTLTSSALRIIAETQASTGETRSQFILRLILSEEAREEGRQQGLDEMRTRVADLLATG